MYYHLQKPWGIEDVKGFNEIRYSNIPLLPKLPEKYPWKDISVREEIIIPKLSGRLICIFDNTLKALLDLTKKIYMVLIIRMS